MYQIIEVRLFFITLSTFSISSLEFSINYVWSYLIFVEIDVSKGINQCIIDLTHTNIFKSSNMFIAKVVTSFPYRNNIIDC